MGRGLARGHRSFQAFEARPRGSGRPLPRSLGFGPTQRTLGEALRIALEAPPVAPGCLSASAGPMWALGPIVEGKQVYAAHCGGGLIVDMVAAASRGGDRHAPRGCGRAEKEAPRTTRKTTTPTLPSPGGNQHRGRARRGGVGQGQTGVDWTLIPFPSSWADTVRCRGLEHQTLGGVRGGYHEH